MCVLSWIVVKQSSHEFPETYFIIKQKKNIEYYLYVEILYVRNIP